MKYHVINPDGAVQTAECGGDGLDAPRLRALVGGDLEYVKVLRDGVTRHMVVNEKGSGVFGQERLQPNARASAIYWENSMVWNVRSPEHAPMGKYDPLTMPLIYGVAVLYEGLLP